MTKSKSKIDQFLRRLRKKAVEWPTDLLKPRKFPATLKDFLRLIVKAKTPADGMARFRRFLIDYGPRSSHWVVDVSQEERWKWMIAELQSINEADERGVTREIWTTKGAVKRKEKGYFTREFWIKIGSAYRYWWRREKSAKARQSAKARRKHTS